MDIEGSYKYLFHKMVNEHKSKILFVKFWNVLEKAVDENNVLMILYGDRLQ